MTQKQLGAEFGVDKRTVMRWEQGQHDPSLTDLRRLAKFFGVTVAHLIGEVGGIADTVPDLPAGVDTFGRPRP